MPLAPQQGAWVCAPQAPVTAAACARQALKKARRMPCRADTGPALSAWPGSASARSPWQASASGAQPNQSTLRNQLTPGAKAHLIRAPTGLTPRPLGGRRCPMAARPKGACSGSWVGVSALRRPCQGWIFSRRAGQAIRFWLPKGAPWSRLAPPSFAGRPLGESSPRTERPFESSAPARRALAWHAPRVKRRQSMPRFYCAVGLRSIARDATRATPSAKALALQGYAALARHPQFPLLGSRRGA